MACGWGAYERHIDPEKMHDLVSGLFSNRYAFGLLICYGINRSETPSGILSNLFCTNELKRLTPLLPLTPP